MYKKLIKFIKNLYSEREIIPLHEPLFDDNEKKLVNEAIESSYVSSIGSCIGQFENEVASYTGAKYAVACINGTSALQISLKLVGVRKNDEVIVPSMTFIAAVNAIHYNHDKFKYDHHKLLINPIKHGKKSFK